MNVKSIIKDIIPPICTRQIQRGLSLIKGNQDLIYNTYKQLVNLNGKIIDPDFFVVAPHGVGLASFIYYLNLIGLPTTCLTHNYYPKVLNEKIYAYGYTCDYAGKFNREYFTKKRRDIFLLLRDPILILLSTINQMIENRLTLIGSWSEYDYGDGLSDHTMEFLINKNAKSYIMYESQMQSIPNYGDIYIYQTDDIMPLKCKETMREILKIFNSKDIDKYDDEIFKIQYNSGKNRLFKYSNYIILKNDIKVFFCQYKFYDYNFNCWEANTKISELQHAGNNYVIFVNNKDNNKIELNNEDIYIIKNYIDMYEEMISSIVNIYEKFKLSPENIVQYFLSKKGKKYRDILLKTLDTELAIIKKIKMNIIDEWNYYKMIL